MSEPRLAAVLVDLATGVRIEVPYDTPLHEESMRWARFHGIDPRAVPAGSEVIRDEERCRVMYESLVYDPPEAAPDYGAIVICEDPDDPDFPFVPTVMRIEQGEAPPLPFP